MKNSIERIIVEHEALQQCKEYLIKKKWLNIIIIADKHTYQAAGKKLRILLQDNNINVKLCLITADKNGDVKADESSIVQALVEIDHSLNAILAVGSGTIHDISRFCSSRTGIPFISIPTAPSVDGFTSLGAPLILQGSKITIAAVAPQALFADMNVLMEAPKEMVAAGVGDMIGKFTSLADWKYGHMTAGEPYSKEVAALTEQSLNMCIENIESIAKKEEKGIRLLMQALIQSGLAMLKFGHSHPASGGEHHLSHYWENAFIKENRKQLLHGAKVAVATLLISDIYKTNRQKLREINITDDIPATDYLIDILQRVEAPTRPSDLEISDELVIKSLKEAHKLRNRFTMLRYLNEK
jgi:glycerol-1-phosphate dehydrogenase [NAD(P)+]